MRLFVFPDSITCSVRVEEKQNVLRTKLYEFKHELTISENFWAQTLRQDYNTKRKIIVIFWLCPLASRQHHVEKHANPWTSSLSEGEVCGVPTNESMICYCTRKAVSPVDLNVNRINDAPAITVEKKRRRGNLVQALHLWHPALECMVAFSNAKYAVFDDLLARLRRYLKIFLS